MSLRPRNRQPQGTGGFARLGASYLQPNLSEFVSNGTPGFPADSFITVENRLSQPVNVSPAFQDGSPDFPIYFTIPAITRSTVPIDPERGVLLTVASDIQLTARSFTGNKEQRYFQKRSVPYRLHSNGAAPSEPLYPIWACQAAEFEVSVTGTQSQQVYVGGWPITAANKIATGPDDICMVAVTLVQFQQVRSGGIVELDGLYDPDAPQNNASQGGMIMFSGNDPIGAAATVSVYGATCVRIGIATGVGADTWTGSLIAWLGIPGA